MQARMPNKVAWLQRKINENRHNLLYYFMFLRLTPLVPNWFLNASSAVVGVPFHIFAGATLIGLAPYTIILVRMGLMLDSISHVGFDASVSNYYFWNLRGEICVSSKFQASTQSNLVTFG